MTDNHMYKTDPSAPTQVHSAAPTEDPKLINSAHSQVLHNRIHKQQQQITQLQDQIRTLREQMRQMQHVLDTIKTNPRRPFSNE